MEFEDLPQIMEIEREVFTDPWPEEMFHQKMELQSAFLLESEQDKRIIGYICGMIILDEYMLTNIAITKSQQHKGYGKMLLTFLLADIIKKGCKKCYLEVRASNKEALDFYHEYGFEIIGRHKQYYRRPVEDALIMQLDLNR